MTTIAYDGRYLVAEGRETMSSTIVRDDTDKFYKIGSDVFVLCGRTSDCVKFSNEFKEGLQVNYTDAGGFYFDGTEVSLVFVCTDTNKIMKSRLTTKYWADGSGRDWAIAALDFGRSAVEAVKYATTRDSHSGGLIRCFDTRTGKFIKVKQ